MDLALEGLLEACELMFMLKLEPKGDVIAFDPAGMAYGGQISVVREDGCWDIALFGDEAGCKSLTRAVYVMEPDEEPEVEEVVDALGELVNMVSGSLKKALGSGKESATSIPLFLEGDECAKFRNLEIEVVARTVGSDDLEGEVFFVWSERTSKALMKEIITSLQSAKPDDTFALGQALSLFEELEEALPEWTDETVREVVEGCGSLMMSIINEEADAGDVANLLGSIGETVVTLLKAVESGQGPVDIDLPKIPEPAAEGAAPQKELQPVERDEEDIELFQEFLEEGVEGVDRCDEILMDMEQGTFEEDYVHEMFRIIHSIKGVASCCELDDITNLTHITEEVLSDAREDKLEMKGHVIDVVFESTEMLRKLLDSVRNSVEKSVEIAEVPTAVAPIIERLEATKRGEVPPAREGAGAADGETVESAGPSEPKAKMKDTVKVDMELLTHLEELCEKLKKTHGTVTDSSDVKGAANDEVLQALGDLGELAEGLKEVSARLRMVDLKPVFQKMGRMVRDLSKKTQKVVKLVLDGEETKVDRKMVEKVGSPLVHMVRNAVDHGIEDAQARKESGKPPLGTIRLSAYHADDHVIVEIGDDGKGLDPQQILRKAKEKGLVNGDDDLSDKEILKLIFAPGFSTAAAVTSISGRGVGMDVVRRDIESVGGHIEIDSVLGSGSTFKMVMPLISKA